ncbi:MAG: hypothetical protein Q8O91_11020, partial [Candidatus Aminicenantes bacterium]|nr:hypothetical protein [Candidatus Aminicenantes bacterium]
AIPRELRDAKNPDGSPVSLNFMAKIPPKDSASVPDVMLFGAKAVDRLLAGFIGFPELQAM